MEGSVEAQLAEITASRAGLSGIEVHPFVTISRQAGAGGHSLAAALLEAFARQDDGATFGGWHVFDRRICEMVVEDPKLTGSLESLVSEEYRSRTEDFIHQLLSPSVSQDYVAERVFRIVRTLAGVGKAVIVGRAGSQATLGLGQGVSLRLVAPEPVRLGRIMTIDHLGEREARNEMKKRDAHRARLVRRHFRVYIDDPLGYDATFNTGTLSFDEIAEAVVAMLRSRVASG